MKASPKLQLVTPTASLVDDYGKTWCDVEAFRSTREFAAYKLSEKKLEGMKEKVSALFVGLAGDKSAIATGERYELAIYPREFQRKVSVLEAFKRLGKAKCLAICAITIKAIEAALGPDAAALIKGDHTGTRKITAALIHQAPKAA